ncbi:hypothetical protein CTEN210_13993 [Chaetoceros tenuissimus]|uniref:NnrU domain-containing protein n=1 Tax=Chaetoceros tenuissimus TaxID=426638 RepID=A0AAD3D4U9_9STRA|nr:hypothetical protein CTEN210_13993 [Chaetoceros tenuissimus]
MYPRTNEKYETAFTRFLAPGKHSRPKFHTENSANSPKLRRHQNLATGLHFSPQDQEVAIWITAFSSTHIGMSAIRQRIIEKCGEIASRAGLINRGIKLPKYWPGDDYGRRDILPDEETAGRQIYRFGYTVISFTTLGNAFLSYLQNDAMKSTVLDTIPHEFLFFTASLSFAAAIASLSNASPLSLMPGFQQAGDYIDDENIGGIQRNDSLKLKPRGLTRITRHPLILPVVPWGIATSFLAGGRTCDFILFGGLAIYAVAGCACQDLRIIREEGSVGTVMSLEGGEERNSLLEFYQLTSFVPFQAVFDGRQPMGGIIEELPYIPFLFGIPIGTILETLILQFLENYI